jgi:hypothetical protein
MGENMNGNAQLFNEHLNKSANFAIYEGLLNTKALSSEFKWIEFYERITEPLISTNKNTPLIGAYKIKDGYKRSNANVEEISALCFDLDSTKGRTFEEIVSLVCKYAGVVHTTHSHTKENPRFRVILALTEPISVQDFQKVREAFLFFNPELAGLIDKSCSDPSRAYYLFSYPKERENLAQCCVLYGEPINPKGLSIPKDPQYKQYEAPIKSTPSYEIPIAEGGRNSELARYVGGLIARGLDISETLSRAIEHNKTFLPPLDINEVHSVNRKIWNTHLNNQNKLPASQAEIEVTKSVGYSLIGAGNLLDTLPPPREWVIGDFLPKKIVAAMIAAGGTGKSILGLHIAASIASGTSLFATFFPSKPAKVIFISGEDDLAELHRRLYKVTQGLSTAVKDLISQNLFFLDLADSFELFTTKSPHQDAKITNVPSKICEAVKDIAGDDIGLVIIDPISRFRGGEENLATDTTRFVQALQQIRDQLNTCVLALHHVNKGAKTNGATQNNARGSSAFIDGVRLVFELNSLTPEDLKRKYGSVFSESRMLLLQSVKSNYGKPIDPIYLSRRDDGSLELQTVLPTDHQNKAILQEIKMSGLSKNQFKVQYGDAQGKFSLSEKALARKLEELESLGFLSISERKPMQITALGEELLSRHSAGTKN